MKATAVRVGHRDFGKGVWLTMEFFPDERDARCYLTDVDCSTKEGCREALSCYRSRWRVEAKGHIPVELCKIASGAKEILAHSPLKMTPKGRNRTRKGPIQPKLDILNFGE